MNDHELDLALEAIGASRTRVSAPSMLRQRVREVPVRTAGPGGFVPLITGRFQSMFSATKFVIAGAIVALFGGLLLTGAVTRPSDDRVPLVGASAPATTQARPTDVETSEPAATPSARTHERTTPDLLPGVDLVTEEVEPRVYRVLGDGVRDLRRRVRDVTVTPDGDVWVEIGRPRDWSIVRLGEPDASLKLGRREPWRLHTTSGGMPVVQRREASRIFDGDAWVPTELTQFEQCLIGIGVLGPDGGCWLGDGGAPLRIDPAGSRTTLAPDDVGLEPGHGVCCQDVGPDGRLWYRVARDAGRASHVFEGLLAYDGSVWSFTPYESDDIESTDGYLAVDDDGVVWVSRQTGFAEDILRWDGESWTAHMVNGDPLPHLWPWPNGVLRIGDVATRWDGTTLEVVESAITAPAFWHVNVGPFGVAPDGSVWVVVDARLYVVAAG